MAAFLLLFLATRLDIDLTSTWERIRGTNPALYMLALLVYYTTFLFRGARWRLLLANAGVSREAPLPSLWASARLVLLGWMASAVTWFRMGDAYRAYAYSLESGAPLPRTVGTVLAERILDVATIFILLIAAFLLLYANAEDRPSTTFLIVGAVLALLALLALLVLHFLRERVNRHLPERVQRVYHSFREGTLSSFRQLPLVALLGLLGWLSEVGRLYLVVQSTGLEVGIGLIVFVTIANAILSAMPLTPGGLGIVEPGIAGLLTLAPALAALEPEDALSVALSVALLDRSISYVSLIIFGSVAFLLHQRARAAHNKVTRPLAQTDDQQPEAT